MTPTPNATHTATPWTLKGANLTEIHANVGLRNFVEYSTTGEGPTRIYDLTPSPSPMVCIGYDRWVQFAPEGWDEMQKANARLIVQAVNAHADLVAALKDSNNLLATITGDGREQAQAQIADNLAALAKAGER